MEDAREIIWNLNNVYPDKEFGAYYFQYTEAWYCWLGNIITALYTVRMAEKKANEGYEFFIGHTLLPLV